jgi:hypothetical protein
MEAVRQIVVFTDEGTAILTLRKNAGAYTPLYLEKWEQLQHISATVEQWEHLQHISTAVEQWENLQHISATIEQWGTTSAHIGYG